MRDWESGRILQSSSLTLEIVNALVELEGARVTEIAQYLDVSKGTSSNHLNTLRRMGYVISKGDEYYPSLKFTHIGEQAKRRDKAYMLAAGVTRQLNKQTPFETTFIVEENGIGRYLTSEVDQPGRHDKFAFAGQEEHLHTIAAGKAILASFSEEQVENIIDRWGLPKKTDYTITSKDELFEELEQVREKGYATNHRENREEIYAIAKAAHNPQGSVFGAMSILTPAFRLKGDKFDSGVKTLLFDHIDQLEQRLKSSIETDS